MRPGPVSSPAAGSVAPAPLPERGSVRVELGERLADLDDVVGLGEDLRDRAAGGGGDLGVDLVGRDLDDGLALLDELALVLDPLEDRPLGDRLAHRGHLDVDDCRRLPLAL